MLVALRIERKAVFVAYPYTLVEEDYRRPYLDAAKEYAVRFEFADLQISDKHILEKIESMIARTAFSIFDLTGWNPNVTLELGIAIGSKKRRFLLFNPSHHTNPAEDVLADVRGFDRIHYGSYSELGRRLGNLLEQQGIPALASSPEPAEDRLQRAPAPSRLDERRLEVLRLLAAGETSKTISQKLSYSERTIKTLIRDVEFELGARSRAQAVAEAIHQGLI
jgi:DNA-binding CsgD family transcriptional regulator